MSMIEQVARAIWFRSATEQDDEMWEHMQEMHRRASREQARAAITALMELDEAMLLAAAQHDIQSRPASRVSRKYDVAKMILGR